METHVVYCSACDRDVRLVFTATPRVRADAGAQVDPTGICLDHSADRCTGSMCALLDQPTDVLLRSLNSCPPVPRA
jgi:hypothetical protein